MLSAIVNQPAAEDSEWWWRLRTADASKPAPRDSLRRKASTPADTRKRKVGAKKGGRKNGPEPTPCPNAVKCGRAHRLVGWPPVTTPSRESPPGALWSGARTLEARLADADKWSGRLCQRWPTAWPSTWGDESHARGPDVVARCPWASALTGATLVSARFLSLECPWKR